MSFRPLYDRVLVSRLAASETTKGGIIIPDTAKEKPVEGKVIAVGTGLPLENGTVRPLAVKEGDTVVFNKWSGKEFTMDGTEYLILKESDIDGVLDTSAAKKKAA